MGLAMRMVNALRGKSGAIERPRIGQIAKPVGLDRWRDYPADGLTPSRLISILRAADDGSIEQAMSLYEQMEEKDAHLYSVAQTLRLAITGLSWQIASAAEVREGV